MKITAAIIIFSIIPFISSIAQPGIGITAGMNNTTFEAQDYFNNSPETQYQFGAYLDFPVLPFLGVTAGINYAKRSSTLEFISPAVPYGNSVPWKYAYSMDYVEIPVLIKLGTPIIPGRLSAAFFAGPQLSFLASGEVETSYYDTGTITTDIKNFDSPAFSLTTGVRLEIKAGIGAFTFDVFYCYDLTESKEAALENYSTEIKMRKYSASVGYYLPLTLL